MKRITLALLLTFALILSLASCVENEGNKDLEKLNELAASLDANYVLTISVESESGNEANKEYTVSTENGTTAVHAKFETINSFSVNGDDITAPDSYTTVTERNLTSEEVANGRFNLPAFNFSSSNLSNIVIVNGTLSAKVASIKNLMGTTLDASNIKLTVKYSNTAIQSIVINYTTSQNDTVTLSYTF